MDTDSPVRMDWSTRSVVEQMDVSLMSAGTLSPTEERERHQTLAVHPGSVDLNPGLHRFRGKTDKRRNEENREELLSSSRRSQNLKNFPGPLTF